MSQSSKISYDMAKLVASSVSTNNLNVVGNTVAQTVSATTAVNLPSSCGYIQTRALTTVTSGTTSFAINHETIAAGKVIFVQINSYGGAGLPSVYVSGVNTTTANLVIRNAHANEYLNATMGISYIIL